MTGIATEARIAIYDLDRTILRRPTFTLFLLWAAWKRSPARLLWALPLYLALAVGYGFRLYGRDRFKPRAIRLFLGAYLTADEAAGLAARFAAWRVRDDVPPGAHAAIARDRGQGYRLLMATAAPEFYAGAIAEALEFDGILASRHRRDAAGNWLPELDGANCYGVEKARRVSEWLDANAADGRRHIRAYSDHPSDAPLFALAHEAWVVGHGSTLAAFAERNGWRMISFESSDLPGD